MKMNSCRNHITGQNKNVHQLELHQVVNILYISSLTGFIVTSSMNRDVNQEGQAVFGSLKGVKVVGKRTDTVIDVTSSTLQA